VTVGNKEYSVEGMKLSRKQEQAWDAINTSHRTMMNKIAGEAKKGLATAKVNEAIGKAEEITKTKLGELLGEDED
jgi:hypothetical protein